MHVFLWRLSTRWRASSVPLPKQKKKKKKTKKGTSFMTSKDWVTSINCTTPQTKKWKKKMHVFHDVQVLGDEHHLHHSPDEKKIKKYKKRTSFMTSKYWVTSIICTTSRGCSPSARIESIEPCCVCSISSSISMLVLVCLFCLVIGLFCLIVGL